MPLITPEYLELQKELHRGGLYGTGVQKNDCAKKIREIAAPGSSVLDYGCGQGKLKPLLPDYDMREYDPCIDGKDGPPDRADYVVCCDVLEHVEPECLDLVLKHMRSLAKRRLVVLVDCRPAKKFLPDGRNAHISLHDVDWWRQKLGSMFRMEGSIVLNDKDGGEALFCVLEPAVEMGKLKAIGVVDDGTRNEYVKRNVGRAWKRINQVPLPDNGKTLIICCYGPSIRHTYRDILPQAKEFNADIVSVSGAHDWLRKKGIKPDWHVECDPRLHKSEMMGKSRRGVKYLMASCCHPDFIKRLSDEGADIILWHLFNGAESFKIRELKSEYEQALIPGGGSVALRAFVLFYFMGYRRFIVHGFDCSFEPADKPGDVPHTHAGPHTNREGTDGTPYKQHVKIRVDGTDEWFETAPVMVTYAQHMLKDLAKGRYPGCEFAFNGKGLFQTMLSKSMDQLNATNATPKATRDYFHLTEEDVDPEEVFVDPDKPKEVANG